jgi:hypothetical protein
MTLYIAWVKYRSHWSDHLYCINICYIKIQKYWGIIRLQVEVSVCNVYDHIYWLHGTLHLVAAKWLICHMCCNSFEPLVLDFPITHRLRKDLSDRPNWIGASPPCYPMTDIGSISIVHHPSLQDIGLFWSWPLISMIYPNENPMEFI